MSTVCPECEHVYKDHKNVFGKICIHCGAYIPPTTILPIVKENQAAHSRLFREFISRHPEVSKQLMEKKDANSNK